jgi:predicted metalloprotease with PDZ domain
MWDLDRLVAKWNELLASYWENPLRETATTRVMEESYWSDPRYEEIAYRGGPFRAMLIDARLRALTDGERGLDDVVRALAERARSAGEAYEGYDNAGLAALLAELSGASWEDFFRRHIDGVEDLPLAELLAHVGLAIAPESRRVFELGFSVPGDDFSIGVAVAAVVPGSAAEGAGIRTGDRLRGFGFISGDPEYEAKLTVERGDETIEIRYLPARASEVPAIRVADRESAERFFRGG